MHVHAVRAREELHVLIAQPERQTNALVWTQSADTVEQLATEFLRDGGHAMSILTTVSIGAVRAWLGLAAEEQKPSPLRDLVQTLDRMDPERAKHLARFAYLLGRVALADRDVSAEETATMERLVVEYGQLSPAQATVVVGLARTSNLLFGGTADFQVAQEFAEAASYEDKLALARCLFAVAATDESVSLAEESEIHRIVNQLKVLPQDLTALRVEHGAFLPGLRKRSAET